MPTNFDFLTKEKQFEPFAEAAVSAEKVFLISASLCATACRTALEFAVKWVYSVDSSLKMPYDDKLASLIATDEFRSLLPEGLIQKVNYLRYLGNNATHSPKSVTRDQAVLALQNLHSFLDFVAYCYSADYIETPFDNSLLDVLIHSQSPVIPAQPEEVRFETLIAENLPKRGKTYVKARSTDDAGLYGQANGHDRIPDAQSVYRCDARRRRLAARL